ncbi:MAG: hypothetical protein IJ383_03670, partial [Bacteroidales bacterium]|nr:hypothetical protein [Bacteroidales bacterium]
GMKTIDELKREVAETRLPEEIKKMFYGVLDTADFASLTEEQQARYESNLKNYMDTMSCIRFARKEGASEGYTNGHADGKAEGLIQGKVETAKAMKAKGLELSFIAECTGLPIEEIENL